MAEICCELVGEGETSAAVEPSSRPSRRRRMEACPIALMADAPLSPQAIESSRKRLKADINSRESGNAVENCIPPIRKFEERVGEDSSEGKGLSANPSVSHSKTSNAARMDDEIRRPMFGVTAVCGRRREMEDAVSIQPFFCDQEGDDSEKLHLFGVFDGHGCSHVAMKCKKRLHEIVKEEIKQEGECVDWKRTMERCYFRMDEEVKQCSNEVRSSNCRCELQASQSDAVGSTAVIAVVTPDKIIVSNCGDSRAVLCRKGKAIPLSSDHKPDRPDELERIEAAGGRVIYWDGARVLGVLAMSRAIGDNYLKPYVIPEPEVTITDRTAEDECLILASDGLWDVVKNETACGVARMCLRSQSKASSMPSSGRDMAADSGEELPDKGCSDASILLTKLALARHSSDNISVVVVDLRR